jgi:hypothetical protein
MVPNYFVVGIMAIAMINGLFSPFFVITAQVMISAILPPLMLAGPAFVTFFASLLAATITIMLAGIPAALFEQMTGRMETDVRSYAIWLAAAALISFPALVRAATLLM